MNWFLRHDKGHQDNITNKINIYIWGQLNMIADIYTKITLWRHISNNGEKFQLNQIANSISLIHISYGGKTISIASNLQKK